MMPYIVVLPVLDGKVVAVQNGAGKKLWNFLSSPVPEGESSEDTIQKVIARVTDANYTNVKKVGQITHNKGGVDYLVDCYECQLDKKAQFKNSVYLDVKPLTQKDIKERKWAKKERKIINKMADFFLELDVR